MAKRPRPHGGTPPSAASTWCEPGAGWGRPGCVRGATGYPASWPPVYMAEHALACSGMQHMPTATNCTTSLLNSFEFLLAFPAHPPYGIHCVLLCTMHVPVLRTFLPTTNASCLLHTAGSTLQPARFKHTTCMQATGRSPAFSKMASSRSIGDQQPQQLQGSAAGPARSGGLPCSLSLPAGKVPQLHRACAAGATASHAQLCVVACPGKQGPGSWVGTSTGSPVEALGPTCKAWGSLGHRLAAREGQEQAGVRAARAVLCPQCNGSPWLPTSRVHKTQDCPVRQLACRQVCPRAARRACCALAQRMCRQPPCLLPLLAPWARCRAKAWLPARLPSGQAAALPKGRGCTVGRAVAPAELGRGPAPSRKVLQVLRPGSQSSSHATGQRQVGSAA